MYTWNFAPRLCQHHLLPRRHLRRVVLQRPQQRRRRTPCLVASAPLDVRAREFVRRRHELDDQRGDGGEEGDAAQREDVAPLPGTPLADRLDDLRDVIVKSCRNREKKTFPKLQEDH